MKIARICARDLGGSLIFLLLCTACGGGLNRFPTGRAWNVWEDPFPHCRYHLTGQVTVERLVPIPQNEAWATAIVTAARRGVVSDLSAEKTAVAFFDSDFYCQVIKLERAGGERTRIEVVGAPIIAIRLRDSPKDLKDRPAQTLEALVQEGVGWKKWRYLSGLGS
jgi:hypothetical protein